VRLILAESTPLPAARALLTLSELDQIGEVQWCAPTRTELEREAVERTLEVHLATPVSPEQIRQMFRDASDYASVTVMTDVAPTDGPPRDPAPAEPSVPSIVPDRPALSGWAAGGEMASSQRASPTVRIDVAQLDLLMNLVGELAIDRGRLRDIIRRAETAADMPDLLDQLVATALHLERVTGELQAEIMKSRMLPISHVFSRFPRLVRDLSRRFDKEVDLVVEGVYTELDRSVIEEVGDPLIHLLRNAIDHGIESPGDREAIGKPRRGTIRLSARHEADQVVIEVSDDGRGIDGKRILRSAREKGLIGPETAAHLDPSEALDLIFLPGLSTAKEISDVSGRGVGLDVVRANLEKLHGSVGLSTTIGRGTTFSLRLPLTLAIVSVLLVVVGPAWYALPVTSVVETLRVEPRATHRLNHHLLVDFRGSALPLVPLAALLGEGGDPLSADSDVERLAGQSLAVIVQHGARRVGLIVDRLVAEQEVVIKPLDPLFGDVDGVAGVAILGDGRVAPILYVPGLIDDLLQAGLSAPAERAASVDAPIRSGSPKGRVRA
jgi:two-component system chemotaxis sensor kinase CheA